MSHQKHGNSGGTFHQSISALNQQNSLSLSKRMQEKTNHASVSSSLPSLKLSKSNSSSSEYFAHLLSPQKKPLSHESTYNRLSGLNESVNNSALFSDITLPPRPITVCVRCGTHASLCMPCAEKDCENALIFYRKTRAAGAATLFQKAFVEAGFTKLIKFVVFRLLKNSIDAKKRIRMKKKTVVEKLFGTNVVSVPFMAWKRYTKENIINRKNKDIEGLSERVKFLEAQVQKLSTQLQENHFQMDFYRNEIAKRDRVVIEQAEQIKELKEDVKAHHLRVKSLVQLVAPLESFNKAVDTITQSKISETNRFIHQAATQASAYNYTYFLGPEVLEPLVGKNPLDYKKTRASSSANLANPNNLNPAMSFSSVTKLTTKLPSKTMAVATLISLNWLCTISKNVEDQIEPTSGKALSHFLPKYQEAETLFDLRSGRNLCRAIVSIICERQALTRNMDMTSSMTSTTSKYVQIWPNNALELEDLEHIKTIENKTMDLISFSLNLATNILEIPSYQAMDIFSGKTEIIYQLVVGLMNAALPKVNKDEKDVIEKKITDYYRITSELHEFRQNKPDLAKFSEVLHFLDKELRVKKQTPVVINPETLVYEKAPSKDEEDQDTAKDGSKVSVTIPESSNENEDKVTDANVKRFDSTADLQQDNSSSPREEIFPTELPTAESQVEEEEEERERIPVMAMSDEHYERLCKLIDQAIDVNDYQKVNEVASKALELNQQLLALQSSITAGRDARELNVRFTTEIRQFLMSHCFNTSFTMTSALQKECVRLEGVANDSMLKLSAVEKEMAQKTSQIPQEDHAEQEEKEEHKDHKKHKAKHDGKQHHGGKEHHK